MDFFGTPWQDLYHWRTITPIWNRGIVRWKVMLLRTEVTEATYKCSASVNRYSTRQIRTCELKIFYCENNDRHIVAEIRL